MGKVLDRTMGILGFSKLIKIPGKSSFDQLEQDEIALMIEAFLEDGNESFDPLAFNDFLHADLQSEKLREIQRDLNANAFLDSSGDDWPRVNRPYLEGLVARLKH